MKRTLALLGVGALLIAACSSGGGNEASPQAAGGGTGMQSSEAPSGGTGCTDLTGDNPFTITIKDFAFHPSCAQVKGSAAITIKNQDSADHTFTIDGTQVDVTIAAGDTFNGESAGLKPGDYEFHCRFHSTMTGTLTVT